MEAFSLLKYWRGSGGGVAGGCGTNGGIIIDVGSAGSGASDAKLGGTRGDTNTTTIRHMAVDLDVEEEDDDGPFFDLEFTVPDECENELDEENENLDEEENETESTVTVATTEEEEEDPEEEADEFDFTVSSGSTGSQTDPNQLSLSPSDDLFFKGHFVPIDTGFYSAESHSKLGSLLKPATKLRVFMLGFKKAKSGEKGEAAERVVESNGSGPGTEHQQKSKSFTVKFKVEEVPIVSLFTRESSSKISANKIYKDEIASEEKKFAKDVLQKYLKMVKPLYVKVSKRYGEKLGFSGQLSAGGGGITSPIASPSKKFEGGETKEVKEMKEGEPNVGKTQKQGNLTAGLRVVCKHLGKSRSASSAVAAVPIPVISKRQDDSLLQQQDGIQSAILHCKRSFNGSRDSESSSLSRSTSDPSHEKSKPSLIDSSRVSFGERK